MAGRLDGVDSRKTGPVEVARSEAAHATTGYETYGPRHVTSDTRSKLPSSLLPAAPTRENMAIALNGCFALRYMTGLGRQLSVTRSS